MFVPQVKWLSVMRITKFATLRRFTSVCIVRSTFEDSRLKDITYFPNVITKYILQHFINVLINSTIL